MFSQFRRKLTQSNGDYRNAVKPQNSYYKVSDIALYSVKQLKSPWNSITGIIFQRIQRFRDPAPEFHG